jgi:RecA-family ATPase
MVISLEDGAKELRRRILAARLHHGVELEEMEGWFFLAAPGLDDGEKLLEIDPRGRLVTGGLAERIEEVIVRRKLDIISLDPLAKLHSVGENDNNAMDKVASILTRMAIKHNIAVDVPHPNSKGPAEPGNAKRGRGASSTKDAFRLVYTLTPMNPDEGKEFGLSEADRRFLIRMDSGQGQYCPAIGGCHLVSACRRQYRKR